MKSLVIFSAVATVALGVYGSIQVFSGASPGKATFAGKLGFVGPTNEVRQPASAPSRLLSEDTGIVATVKEKNASRGRSPAVENSSADEAQVVARYKNWMKDHGLGEKHEAAKAFFPATPEGEVLSIAMIVSAQGERDEQLQEIYHWANVRMYENANSTIGMLGGALAKLPRDQTNDRDWVVSVIYGIGKESPGVRKDVRGVLLQEVNRQGIQSLEGMTTLVKLLRVQKNQEWVNEVRKEFEEMNPGTELGEIVALRTE